MGALCGCPCCPLQQHQAEGVGVRIVIQLQIFAMGSAGAGYADDSALEEHPHHENFIDHFDSLIPLVLDFCCAARIRA
jgi:hypothetical protein